MIAISRRVCKDPATMRLQYRISPAGSSEPPSASERRPWRSLSQPPADRAAQLPRLPRPGRRTIATALACLLSIAGLLAAVVSPAAADEVSDKKAEAAQIAKKLDELRRQQIALAEDFNQANLKLGQAQADIAAAEQQVEQITKEYGQRKDEIRLYAVQAYMHGNDSPIVNAILTADGDKGPQKKGYLEAASGNRQDAVDRLQATRRKLDEELARLDQAKAEAQSATEKAEAAKRTNDRAVAEEAAIHSRVQGELGQLVAQEQARIAEAQQRANEAKLEQLRQAEAARQTTTTAPPTSGAPGTAAPRPSTTTTTNRPSQPTPGPTPAPTPGPAPAPKPSPAPGPVPPSSKGAAAAAAAMSQLGVPYRYGGASPSTGFDCSGLVMWAYAQVGVSLPHATTAQWAATTPISMSELQVGDIVFFYGLGHNGIYIGGGMVVHAPHTGDVVRTERIANMPIDGARRVR